jgi:hypothetical protein
MFTDARDRAVSWRRAITQVIWAAAAAAGWSAQPHWTTESIQTSGGTAVPSESGAAAARELPALCGHDAAGSGTEPSDGSA